MVTICPKCGKKAWKPYKFVIKGKSGKNYTYLVYRHNEKKRHTPRKCYVAQKKTGKAAPRKGATRSASAPKRTRAKKR